MLLAFVLKGPIGKVGQGKVYSGTIGFGKPALVGLWGSICHGA